MLLKASSFTFEKYKINPKRGIVTFSYTVEFKFGIKKTFTDTLIFKNIDKKLWQKVPENILKPTMESLLLMIGINYWCIFPTNNIHIRNFSLTKEQAEFWELLYLNGLGEFFYDMKIDFHNLIKFPYDESLILNKADRLELPNKSLLLNGAGKDSILSAEILKASNVPFDFFAFAPTPAHKKVAKLVGAKTIKVKREFDFWMEFYRSTFAISTSYPSVSTFTFTAVLLAELLGYNKIIFSNERSADFGNFNYLGLEVNHQWCKSSQAEKMINDYIQKYITPDISSNSLLREYSELEIVKRFVKHKKYLPYVTSCNNYFWLPLIVQFLMPKAYWCRKCPKCVFLFTCFSAFLPKKEVLKIFGGNIYKDKTRLRLFKRILGVEGTKPLDCVGEPEEMILAMHYVNKNKEYEGEDANELFKKYFPENYDFDSLEKKLFTEN